MKELSELLHAINIVEHYNSMDFDSFYNIVSDDENIKNIGMTRDEWKYTGLNNTHFLTMECVIVAGGGDNESK